MKKMFQLWRLASALLIASAVFIVSCRDDEMKSSGSQDQDENLSEVASIEKKLGTTLYKKELTLTDESGENKVTVRIAGRDQAMLEEYLKARTFSIEPVYSHDRRGTLKQPTRIDGQQSKGNDRDERYESTVIIEFVSQELKAGVMGVGFRDRPNPSYKADNSGRVKYYNYSEHVSNNWPSVLSFQAYYQVEFMIWFKGRWYQSWNPVFGPDTWCCYDYYDFDVDGPWRVSLRIQYDYSGDYYYQWFY